MGAVLREALGLLLDTEVRGLSPVSGGDINDSYRASLADGREVFVKTHARPLPGMYEREAEGLRWLAEPGALRIPEVLWAGDARGTQSDRPSRSSSPDGATQSACPAMLVLEYIAPGRLGAERAVALGRGLAELHRSGAPGFGGEDNYLATLPQDNAPCDSWSEFYAERRLRPLVRRAHDAGLLGHGLVGRFEALLARMDDAVGEPEPPARLHGDLWGGNVITDVHGAPVLVDPAVYGGHREVDLAMLDLFGGGGDDCLEAYAEVYPLSPGRAERVPLYQLYPLLVHLLLFGRGYLGQLSHTLDTMA